MTSTPSFEAASSTPASSEETHVSKSLPAEDPLPKIEPPRKKPRQTPHSLKDPRISLLNNQITDILESVSVWTTELILFYHFKFFRKSLFTKQLKLQYVKKNVCFENEKLLLISNLEPTFTGFHGMALLTYF